MQKVGKQTIEGSDHVRVYHSPLLLGERGIPILVGEVHEVAHLLFQAEQRSFAFIARSVGFSDEVTKAMIDQEKPGDVHSIVTAVNGFDGVAYATAIGFQLIVVKGKMFEWGPIESKLLSLMSTFNLGLETSKILDLESEV